MSDRKSIVFLLLIFCVCIYTSYLHLAGALQGISNGMRAGMASAPLAMLGAYGVQEAVEQRMRRLSVGKLFVFALAVLIASAGKWRLLSAHLAHAEAQWWLRGIWDFSDVGIGGAFCGIVMILCRQDPRHGVDRTQH